MLVVLKRDWFGPDATLHRVRNNPHTFPAGWDLPPDAEVKEEAKPKPALKKD